jgi:hypothetical protein
MQEAEAHNRFAFDPSKLRDNLDNEDDGDEVENEQESKPSSNENTLASIAKKIQETKLNSPVRSEVQHSPSQQQQQQKAVVSKDNDLDLDIDDVDLDNVDTSDVNLDDELSDNDE